MNQNTTFVRKIIYISIIVALLPPLFLLGQPATEQRGQAGSRGGVLANMRAENDLSQASLGEIDPASESMKLATLGLNGVATNILWTKANEYKKTQQWDKLSATLNQISKLQPNFIGVWESQAHNLSYNVSVEFDNYEHRYAWVKRGMHFLMDGIDKNRREPRLTHYMGWFVSQKFGRADEHVQFRRLFRRDRDFHRDLAVYVQMDAQDVLGPDNLPDNWLVGRKWYLRAYDQVENQGEPLQGKSPLVFYSSAPLSRINYVTTIASEGYLDEQAAEAWEVAEAEWLRFGLRHIPTSWGHNIQLEKYEELKAERDQLLAQFLALAPGLHEKITQEKREQLPAEVRTAIDTPAKERTDQQHGLAYRGLMQVAVSHREIVARMPADLQPRAKGMARHLEELDHLSERIKRYRNTINYVYWRTLCEVEKQDIAIQARKHLYQAERLREEADLYAARDEYNKAWELWAEIYDRYPLLMEDVSARDIIEIIERGYVYVLGQLDEPFPADFKLMNLLEAHHSELSQTRRAERQRELAPSQPETPATDEPAEDSDTQPPKTDRPPEEKESAPAEPEPSPEPKTEASPEPIGDDAPDATPPATEAADTQPDDSETDDSETAAPADAPASPGRSRIDD